MALGPPDASRGAVLATAGIGAGVEPHSGAVSLRVVSQRRHERAAGKPRRYRGTRLLKAGERHLVSRFSYGITPQLAGEVRAAGGARDWWEAQLRPENVPDPFADQLSSWWPTLGASPQDLWAQDRTGTMRAWGVCQDYQRYVLLRRIFSRRQVLEVVSALWEGHLEVPLDGRPHYLFRKAYGDTLRAHALGRYEELVLAAVTHPAMLVHLGNSSSTAGHVDDRLARELLGRHTVGSGYTDEDVTQAARILTGWHVDTHLASRNPTWVASYVPEDHWVGPVRVMGLAEPNDSPDGREVTRRLVGHLCRHPSTALRVARKLVVAFVRDVAPPSLVERLAQVYLDHDTAIVPVLRALIASPEFATSRKAKRRDASEDLVGTWRALGAGVRRPAGLDSAANTIVWQADDLGLMPFRWPRPDEVPVITTPWDTSSGRSASADMHHCMASGYWPTAGQGMVYRQAASWLPPLPIRLDQLVDHLTQQLLHQHASAALVEACCRAVGYAKDTSLDERHPVVRSAVPALLTTVLDSPDFLLR